MEFISKEKLADLIAELDYLKTTKRQELAENLQRARGLGDLSENAEYHTAREEQGHAEDRIRQLEFIIKNAKVVDGAHHSESVSVGSVLEIKKKGDKVGKQIEIVGGEESDLLQGKISYKSPLGAALLGHVNGDKVEVDTPKGVIEYKITDLK